MLQIRRHLDRCPVCRRELEAASTVKNLLGALAPVRPPVEYHSGMLDRAPARAPRWAFVQRSWLAVWHSVSEVDLVEFLPLTPQARAFLSRPLPLRSTDAVLALTSGLAIAAVSAGILQGPQHEDAIAAHVPAVLAGEADAGAREGEWVHGLWPAQLGRPVSSSRSLQPVSQVYLLPGGLELTAPTAGGSVPFPAVRREWYPRIDPQR
jgi:hypothetical protein